MSTCPQSRKIILKGLVLVGHYFAWHIRVLSEVFLVAWTSRVGLQV
jgi:hypothetical protein